MPDVPRVKLVSDTGVTRARVCRAADSASGARAVSSPRMVSAIASGSAINAKELIRKVLTSIRPDYNYRGSSLFAMLLE